MLKNHLHAKLSHRIRLLENMAVSPIETDNWQEQSIVFAEVKPIVDNKFIALEGLDFGHLISEEYYIFTIRFIDHMHIAMRIKMDDKEFSIKRIINIDHKSRLLKIIALTIN